MTHQYDYRWQRATVIFLIIIFFASYFDLQTEWQVVRKQQQQKKMLLQKLHQSESIIHPIVVRHKEELQFFVTTEDGKEWDALFAALNISSLKVKMIHFQKEWVSQWLLPVAALNLTGNFSAFFQLMNRIVREPHLRLWNVSFLVDEKMQLQLNAKIILAPLIEGQKVDQRDQKNNTYSPLSMPFSANKDWLFCGEKEEKNLFPQNDAARVMFSIQDMKMVGYLAYESSETAQAFLLLPNHQMLTVYVGEAIGKEKATIEQILPHHILLITANHIPAQIIMK